MVLLTPQQARAGAQLASQQATAAREEAPRSALGWHGDVEAEPEAELFEIINPDTGDRVGTAPRALAHATGLWHRAVYVLVFNGAGELLIQKRSADKKVCPSQWDLSAAEHSSVGETYREAVVRGLSEELGIQLPDSCLQQAEVSSTAHASIGTSQQHGEGQSSNVLPRLWGPLTPTHKRTLDLPHIGIHDYELVETWRLDSWSHETCGLRYNMNEVSEVRWIDIRELRPWMEREPQSFTPWFVDEAKLLGLV